MPSREVLVVDDEPMLCRALESLFSEKGFHVTTAGTAYEALEHIRHKPTDFVLLDLRLPDLPGLEVLSELRAKHPDVRVVIISAFGDQAIIKEAFERGANDFLAKPFDFSRCFFVAMGVETAELADARSQPEARERVPASVAQKYQVLPLSWEDHTLRLAMEDPLDVQRVDELKTLLECEIHPVAAIGTGIEEAIQRSYGVGAGVATRPGAVTAPGPSRSQETDGDRDETSGVIRLMNDLIQHAHGNRATDLHIGIGPTGPWIRERVDGILYEVPVAPQFADLYASVVSRLKVMAKLDIAEHRLPQDGRIWFVHGNRLDLRVSILPSVHGENVSIRLLEPSRIFELDQIGMTTEQLEAVKVLLDKPTGMLLVTGPTGSGKTTTLYAFLEYLNTGKTNIVTIEDPVEHELPGLTQMQIHPKVGLNFATGLRSMLRHDPDIIMVGEVRDEETASLAVRASLTGHQVLSTLHTNDAASGITRLLDLGIEPFLLCSTLTGVLSQRLVRTLCRACRELVDVEAAAFVPLGVTVPAKAQGRKLWRPGACSKCRNTGYYGRTAIFELLTVDSNIRSLMIKRTSGFQVRQSAVSRGMMTLAASGWERVQRGETSLEELLRVLPAELR